MTKVEIRQLCKIYKKWFGDFETLEKVFANNSNGRNRIAKERNKEQSYSDLVQTEKIRDIEGEILVKIDKDVIQTVTQYFND